MTRKKSSVAGAYVIMSTGRFETGILYCGSSRNIEHRRGEHNARTGGSQFTNDPGRQPWVCVAYVTGFEGVPESRVNKERRQRFERDVHDWCEARQRLRTSSERVTLGRYLNHLGELCEDSAREYHGCKLFIMIPNYKSYEKKHPRGFAADHFRTVHMS
jgi:predicted GIY-YIG superfamily endonuclease